MKLTPPSHLYLKAQQTNKPSQTVPNRRTFPRLWHMSRQLSQNYYSTSQIQTDLPKPNNFERLQTSTNLTSSSHQVGLPPDSARGRRLEWALLFFLFLRFEGCLWMCMVLWCTLVELCLVRLISLYACSLCCWVWPCLSWNSYLLWLLILVSFPERKCYIVGTVRCILHKAVWPRHVYDFLDKKWIKVVTLHPSCADTKTLWSKSQGENQHFCILLPTFAYFCYQGALCCSTNPINEYMFVVDVYYCIYTVYMYIDTVVMLCWCYFVTSCSTVRLLKCSRSN